MCLVVTIAAVAATASVTAPTATLAFAHYAPAGASCSTVARAASFAAQYVANTTRVAHIASSCGAISIAHLTASRITALTAARAMVSISGRTAVRVPACCPLFAAGSLAPRIAAAASAAVCRARSLSPSLGAQGWSLQKFVAPRQRPLSQSDAMERREPLI